MLTMLVSFSFYFYSTPLTPNTVTSAFKHRDLKMQHLKSCAMRDCTMATSVIYSLSSHLTPLHANAPFNKTKVVSSFYS